MGYQHRALLGSSSLPSRISAPRGLSSACSGDRAQGHTLLLQCWYLTWMGQFVGWSITTRLPQPG